MRWTRSKRAQVLTGVVPQLVVSDGFLDQPATAKEVSRSCTRSGRVADGPVALGPWYHS